jgi:hypothetical protein
MKRSAVQGFQGLRTIVALVEDQGDVIAGFGQLPVVGGKFDGDGAELGTVVDIASMERCLELSVRNGM